MASGRHPFQRKKNSKKTVRTPFQRELVAAIEGYSADGRRMSGRQLSLLLGRSANMISQLLNDGLVPSGETVLQIAEVLELDRAGTDRIIRAAIKTKGSIRSRDHFWILESTRMIDEVEEELAIARAFILDRGLEKPYAEFLAKRRKAVKRKRAPKDRPRADEA